MLRCTSPHMAQTGSWRVGRACPLCPSMSDINLFCYCQGVIDLDAEIPHGAFDLGVSEQKLDGPEVASPPVDQGSFCASQGMRPEQPWVQSNAADPLGEGAHIAWWSCCDQDRDDR